MTPTRRPCPVPAAGASPPASGLASAVLPERWDRRQSLDQPGDLRRVGIGRDLDEERVDRGAVVGDGGIELVDGAFDLGPALVQPRVELFAAGGDTHVSFEA